MAQNSILRWKGLIGYHISTQKKDNIDAFKMTDQCVAMAQWCKWLIRGQSDIDPYWWAIGVW